MTQTRKSKCGTFNAGLPDWLAAEGFSSGAAEALIAFDTEMFAWHRRSMKGELAGRLLVELGAEMELSQFHALTAINRIRNGIGRAGAEPATVGLLAEEMGLDPSRASRIATGLIEAGWLKREVDQEDGRKSLLVLTARAHEVFTRLRQLKWAKLMSIFRAWDEADIIAFSRLFARYSEGVAQAACAEGDER